MIEAAKVEMAEWEKQQEVQRESKVPTAPRPNTTTQQSEDGAPRSNWQPASTLTIPHALPSSSSSPGARRPPRTGRRSKLCSRT